METVIHGECIEVMRGMEPDSVDAIVCDPPYDLTEIPAGRLGGFVRSDEDRARRRGGFMGKAWDGTGIAFRPEIWEEALRVAKPGAYLLAAGSPRTYHRLACAIEDAGWVLIDCIQHIHGQGFPKGKGQLKPGYEPWTLARKPAPKVLPLQIDAARISHNEPIKPMKKQDHVNSVFQQSGRYEDTTELKASGRWPANIILSEEVAAEMDETVGERKSGGRKGAYSDASTVNCYGKYQSGPIKSESEPSGGGPSRYFYTAKASTAERALSDGTRSNHPTMKPISLMRWLCRLVTPPNGTVLDPFCGSGTTLLACRSEGFDCIGIEREAEYCEIIHKRLAIPEPTGQLSLLEA